MLKKLLCISSIILFFSSCENIEITHPGNNQDLDPKPPSGDIEWSLTTDDENRGLLEENSQAGKTIGILNATDPNPDDEFTYQIGSQKMDNTAVNYFVINSVSGVTSLELANGNIDFESLTGSKQIDVIISVSDDSPEPQTSDFSIAIKVINVNETPYFTNLNRIIRYADEYVDYYSPRIEWTDTDEGQTPTFSASNLPAWLSITDEGIMSGQPSTSDIGNHEFLLTITDGEIDVQEEININVRQNNAPVFLNESSIPSLIRVGCYDNNQTIVDVNWRDNDNNGSGFNGNDEITFSHLGTENVDWLNFDNQGNGILFCVEAPTNSDASTTSITISITDDRPNVSKATELSFNLSLAVNSAPTFSNLENIQSSLEPGSTFSTNVTWQDPEEDQINFSVNESFDWFEWDTFGNITAAPDSGDLGQYDLHFSISDGCYTTTSTKTFTVE